MTIALPGKPANLHKCEVPPEPTRGKSFRISPPLLNPSQEECMFHASRVALLCLLGTALLSGGCAVAPNSFRIEGAESIHDRFLFPPGTALNYEKLYLHV